MTVTHDLDVLPEGSERLDDYLTRRWPGRNWLLTCSLNLVEVRDYFDVKVGTYTKDRWFVQWWDGHQWKRLGDLQPGERPRMHETYCYIVREGEKRGG